MLKRLLVIVLVIAGTLSFANSTWAYSGEVHFRIGEAAVLASQMDSVIKAYLGFESGIDAELKSGKLLKPAWEWVAFGGEAEDYGYAGKANPSTSRAFNHFHDPLKDWDGAGLEDPVVELIYYGSYFRFPVSPILWGLKPGEQDFSMNFTGDWSWGKARQYYHDALTGLTENDRGRYFADCFRALGQVLHLLQDMSVPLHTRNDVHVFPLIRGSGQYPFQRWTYETYTQECLLRSNFGGLDLTPDRPGDRPDSRLLEVPAIIQDPNYGNLVPVTGLFDRNAYNESGAIPQSESLGLAEYSNANFLSQDTMWTYPHPSLEDTNYATIDWLNPEQVDAEDGKTDNRIYIKKVVGEQIDHLAAADYWSFEYWGLTEAVPAVFSLDEKCWKDYAAKLVPRAVGYSAALLDYFFRGKIEISNAQLGYNPVTRVMDSITLLAKNVTENAESMTNGTVDIVVKHKNWNEQEYHHSVTRIGGASSIPRNEAEFVVYLSDPIPVNTTDAQVFVVFRGKLGLENGGIGVGFKEVLSTLVNEIWDNGLTGNHLWQHTSGGHESGNGAASNVVSDGILWKSNLRYVGEDGACYNESYLLLADAGYPQGIMVRPDTFVHFRIPRMDINHIPPAPPGETASWQALNLMFNNGYGIQFSRPGQEMDYGPKTAHYYFDPSLIIFENIHDLFQGAGISVSEPLYLEAIDLIQQLFDLEEPSTIAHHQEMEMDFVRIIGRK